MKANILIILTILVVLISSCRTREIAYFKLTDEVKQVIPYEKGDIVSFMDSDGQVINFMVTENITRWAHVSDNNFRNDYYSFEIKEATLKSEINNLVIKLKISNPICDPDDCDPNDVNNDLYILSIGVEYYELGFNNICTDRKGDFLTSTYISNDSIEISTIFSEFMEINNNVFYNVVESILKNNNTQYIYRRLLYSKTYGILQVCKDGEILLTINN